MASSEVHIPVGDKQKSPDIAFNLGVIAVCATVVGLGFAYLIDAVSTNRAPLPTLSTAGPTIEKTIGGHTLAIPPAWFRYQEQRVPGFTEQIDLAFALPLGPNRSMREVNVVMQPTGRARSSARLLDAVYLHQFLPEQLEGPLGLIGKPLRDGDGFQNETVWYDPLTADPFVAKCVAPVSENMPAICVRTIDINNTISVTYAFDQEILHQWRDFDTEAGLWLTRIGGI